MVDEGWLTANCHFSADGCLVPAGLALGAHPSSRGVVAGHRLADI